MPDDLISILERDPELLRLATLNPEPYTALEFAAQALVRAREVEAKRQQRRREEAERRDRRQDELHRRAMAPPAPAPPRPGGFTEEQIYALAKAVAPPIREFVEGTVADAAEALDRKLTDLKGRVMGVEERPHMRYRGIFDLTTRYEPGDVTTRHGVLWHADRATVGEVPGNGPTAWKMMNKSQR